MGVSMGGKKRRSFFLFLDWWNFWPNLGRMGEKTQTELLDGDWSQPKNTTTKLIVFMLWVSVGMQDVCWFVSTIFLKFFWQAAEFITADTSGRPGKEDHELFTKTPHLLMEVSSLSSFSSFKKNLRCLPCMIQLKIYTQCLKQVTNFE